jgi:hypothetical protein
MNLSIKIQKINIILPLKYDILAKSLVLQVYRSLFLQMNGLKIQLREYQEVLKKGFLDVIKDIQKINYIEK